MIDDATKDSMIKNFAANCVRLGDECREHALEVKRLNSELLEAGRKIHKLQQDNEELQNRCDFLEGSGLE